MFACNAGRVSGTAVALRQSRSWAELVPVDLISVVLDLIPIQAAVPEGSDWVGSFPGGCLPSI